MLPESRSVPLAAAAAVAPGCCPGRLAVEVGGARASVVARRRRGVCNEPRIGSVLLTLVAGCDLRDRLRSICQKKCGSRCAAASDVGRPTPWCPGRGAVLRRLRRRPTAS